MSLRVLLVDDSPAMRWFLRRTILLSQIEVDEVLEAGDGEEALAQLAAHSVDLILCDVNMPVMNGEAFLERLHLTGATNSVTVLMVSGDSTLTRMERMLALGARGYMQKPFTPESMRQTIESVMPHLQVGGAG